ncbi:hypothetical protein VTN96DRAFT_9551 [Rasamsonia emersonii]
MDGRSPPSFLRSFSIGATPARPQAENSAITARLPPTPEPHLSFHHWTLSGNGRGPLQIHLARRQLTDKELPDCLPMAFRLVAAQHNRGMLSLAGSMASLRDVSWIPEQPCSTNLPGSMQRCAGHP